MRGPSPTSVRLGAALASLFLAFGASAFERTEQRTPCAANHPLRHPYFGDTHVHTSFSFDANALGVRNTPRDAYRFARGAPLGLQPYDDRGQPLRTATLDRPLDFAVVTDHAGLLGEVRICRTPGVPGHDSLVCRLVRRWPLLAYYVVSSRAFNTADPVRYGFCGPGGARCIEAAAAPWREIQQAAEEAYDRSDACRFTSFVGYEWTGGPDGNMIHRNVVFRNTVVPNAPTSYFEEPTPEGLWRRLREECLDGDAGCDVLAIPHNSNLSGGQIFRTESGDGAAMEPLVEILQHKGDSECRLSDAGADELCDFEKLPYARMDVRNFPFLWSEPPPLSFVREALAEGLRRQDQTGVNPLQLGIIASTDTHLGTPGLVDERTYPGHGAGGDTSQVAVPRLPDSPEFGPGGLAVLWAEENSRDALFEAMRRREAYGTSGPRIVVRFFGGWNLSDDACESGSLVREGYARGVPMGGDLAPSTRGEDAPVFSVWALRDPGTDASPGAPLQRIQIVKAAATDDGVQWRIYDVAGDPDNGARVDTRTCERSGDGFDELCRVWRDPDFDRERPALYYARVVENPSCRWTAWACNANGVDCRDPKTAPGRLAACCAPDLRRTIQERAWTSPIWYAPTSAANGRAASGSAPSRRPFPPIPPEEPR